MDPGTDLRASRGAGTVAPPALAPSGTLSASASTGTGVGSVVSATTTRGIPSSPIGAANGACGLVSKSAVTARQ
ncbi:MAG TPA: hypothetical protein VIL43_08990 [Burkholderiales bacterium]